MTISMAVRAYIQLEWTGFGQEEVKTESDKIVMCRCPKRKKKGVGGNRKER